jgi:hypothetical protein
MCRVRNPFEDLPGFEGLVKGDRPKLAGPEKPGSAETRDSSPM